MTYLNKNNSLTTAVNACFANDKVDLEGVFHSINEPTRWYGADAILDQWHDTMLQLIQKTMQQQGQPSSPEKKDNLTINQLGDLLRSFQK
jgi:hypothetical protein